MAHKDLTKRIVMLRVFVPGDGLVGSSQVGDGDMEVPSCATCTPLLEEPELCVRFF